MNKKIICEGIYKDRGEDNKREVNIDDLSFRISTYAVIIKGNKILLIPQWDGYDFPGGKIDLGETMDESFIREVQEETGIIIERGEVLQCES